MNTENKMKKIVIIAGVVIIFLCTSSIRTARLMRIGRRLPVTALPVMGTI